MDAHARLGHAHCHLDHPPTSDRFRLEDLVGNRNRAQNYVWQTTNVPERRANDVAECKSRVVAVQEVSQLPRVLPGQVIRDRGEAAIADGGELIRLGATHGASARVAGSSPRQPPGLYQLHPC